MNNNTPKKKKKIFTTFKNKFIILNNKNQNNKTKKSNNKKQNNSKIYKPFNKITTLNNKKQNNSKIYKPYNKITILNNKKQNNSKIYKSYNKITILNNKKQNNNKNNQINNIIKMAGSFPYKILPYFKGTPQSIYKGIKINTIIFTNNESYDYIDKLVDNDLFQIMVTVAEYQRAGACYNNGERVQRELNKWEYNKQTIYNIKLGDTFHYIWYTILEDDNKSWEITCEQTALMKEPNPLQIFSVRLLNTPLEIFDVRNIYFSQSDNPKTITNIYPDLNISRSNYFIGVAAQSSTEFISYSHEIRIFRNTKMLNISNIDRILDGDNDESQTFSEEQPQGESINESINESSTYKSALDIYSKYHKEFKTKLKNVTNNNIDLNTFTYKTEAYSYMCQSTADIIFYGLREKNNHLVSRLNTSNNTLNNILISLKEYKNIVLRVSYKFIENDEEAHVLVIIKSNNRYYLLQSFYQVFNLGWWLNSKDLFNEKKDETIEQLNNKFKAPNTNSQKLRAKWIKDFRDEMGLQNSFDSINKLCSTLDKFIFIRQNEWITPAVLDTYHIKNSSIYTTIDYFYFKEKESNFRIEEQSDFRILSRSLGTDNDKEQIAIIYKKIDNIKNKITIQNMHLLKELDYYENFFIKKYRNENIGKPEFLTMVYKQINYVLDKIISSLE